MARALLGSPGARPAGSLGRRAYIGGTRVRGDPVSGDIRVTESCNGGQLRWIRERGDWLACIERPDFASGQPGQPDFNFASLGDPIPRFTLRERSKDSAPLPTSLCQKSIFFHGARGTRRFARRPSRKRTWDRFPRRRILLGTTMRFAAISSQQEYTTRSTRQIFSRFFSFHFSFKLE